MKRALAAVCALLCLVALGGCHSHRPLKLPEVISLQKEIREMPVVNDVYNNYCPVNYSRGLVFYIACGDLTREEALAIARKVRELFIQEEFMDTFLTTVGSGDSEYYRACNRCPAHVEVVIHGDSYPRMPRERPVYIFWADFFADHDMSGKGYIYDGYSTWHGEHKKEAITMEEILGAE